MTPVRPARLSPEQMANQRATLEGDEATLLAMSAIYPHWRDACLAGARALHALLAATETPSGWQDISTAPKDGTLMLVWAPGVHGLPSMHALCAYHADAGFCIDELRAPTHWMPLPTPPRPGEDK